MQRLRATAGRQTLCSPDACACCSCLAVVRVCFCFEMLFNMRMTCLRRDVCVCVCLYSGTQNDKLHVSRTREREILFGRIICEACVDDCDDDPHLKYRVSMMSVYPLNGYTVFGVPCVYLYSKSFNA